VQECDSSVKVIMREIEKKNIFEKKEIYRKKFFLPINATP